MRAPTPLEPLQVLIVEDHPDTLAGLELILSGHGYRVRCADRIATALQRLAETPCDVLVLDLGLPDGNGWEVLERAQLDEHVHVIVLSAWGDEKQVEKLRSYGYRDFLIKPLGVDQLIPRIEASRHRGIEASRHRGGEAAS